jgi:EpsI family protein
MPQPAEATRRGLLRAAAVGLCMVAASVAADKVQPTHRMVDHDGRINIAASIPLQLGAWKNEPQTSNQVVSPDRQAALDAIYSQVVSRVYVNDAGQRIMLSVAYGEDQRDGMALHYPEVCYPSQGFQVRSNVRDQVQTARGAIPVRRLQTDFNAQRPEPVTYWVVIGRQHTLGGMDKKLIEMRYAVDGLIPDGLLFRVSSIDADPAHAFALQDDFIRAFVSQAPRAVLPRLAGLP